MFSRSLLAFALLADAGCSRDNRVGLAFVEIPTGDGVSVPHGFFCKVGGRVMAGIASDAASDGGVPPDSACIVTDVTSWLGDYPGCRPAQLIDFCLTHECKPRRRGVVPVPVEQTGTVAERVSNALQQLEGLPADLWNAPDDTVIVRVFATFQSCEALDPGPNGTNIVEHDGNLLFGCASSCPVRLDDVRGDLLLDLDSLEPDCERSVRTCASDAFARGAVEQEEQE